jgi:hypothetical protein
VVLRHVRVGWPVVGIHTHGADEESRLDQSNKGQAHATKGVQGRGMPSADARSCSRHSLCVCLRANTTPHLWAGGGSVRASNVRHTLECVERPSLFSTQVRLRATILSDAHPARLPNTNTQRGTAVGGREGILKCRWRSPARVRWPVSWHEAVSCPPGLLVRARTCTSPLGMSAQPVDACSRTRGELGRLQLPAHQQQEHHHHQQQQQQQQKLGALAFSGGGHLVAVAAAIS